MNIADCESRRKHEYKRILIRNGNSANQHVAFKLGFGASYPCPDQVRAVLSPEDGKPKAILDLGEFCGLPLCSPPAHHDPFRFFRRLSFLIQSLILVSLLPRMRHGYMGH